MGHARDTWYDLRSRAHGARAAGALAEQERRHARPEERFEVPFAYRGSGHFKKLAPRQNREEIRALYDLVLARRPRRVLEIGTARGGTLYLWTQAAADDAVLVSVDLPGGRFGGGYPACRAPFYRSFARAQQEINLVRADSHDPATFEEVRDRFGSEPIDFAFIDGDHTYEGARRDYEQYGPLVRPGGIIAFHDILPRPAESGIEVARLWEELRPRYEVREFIGSREGERPIGIGVVFVEEATADRPKTALNA
jgi:predicted O-methyltransferase YrrM